MANYLTDEEKDYILKNRLKLTIGQISQNLNRKHQTIQSFLRKNKLLYLNKTSFKSNQELTKRQEEVLKLISKGYSNEEISEKFTSVFHPDLDSNAFSTNIEIDKSFKRKTSI